MNKMQHDDGNPNCSCFQCDDPEEHMPFRNVLKETAAGDPRGPIVRFSTEDLEDIARGGLFTRRNMARDLLDIRIKLAERDATIAQLRAILAQENPHAKCTIDCGQCGADHHHCGLEEKS